MILRSLALFTALAAASPLAGQSGDAPRGTFLVYAEDSGVAFVSRETSLVEAGVWPLEFHYFDGGETAGTARMRARADCALGVVRGRLTHVNGMPLPEEQAEQTPDFTFDRAAPGGGDPAIVDFICAGDSPPPADMAISRSVGDTVAVYTALAALGLAPEIAARLAVRDEEAGAALAATLVPEAQRAAALAALGAEDGSAE